MVPSHNAGPRGTPHPERDTSLRHALQVGVGRAMAHHGELLQGVFEGDDGRLHRGLITLPLPALQATATFWPGRARRSIRTRPAGRTKAQRAVALTLKYLGYAGTGGDLTIESAIPLGHGYGSSTADVIAAIRAVAAAAGVTLRRATVCRVAVAAEAAADAVAYGDQVVLFAHREGSIIEHLAGEYPPFLVVGLRSRSGSPVNTLLLPRARYDSSEIGLFRALRGLARHAVQRQNPRLLGRVATVSAHVSQRYLSKPHFGRAVQLAEDHGACGVQVSHSGTVIGVLVDAQASRPLATAAAIARLALDVGFADVSTFALNADNVPLP